MKKFIAGLIVGLILFTTTFSIGAPSLKLIVNGTDITSEAQPVTIDGRTLVPARALAEQLGASVNWDPSKATVFVKKENTLSYETIKLYADIMHQYKRLGDYNSLINGALNTLEGADKGVSLSVNLYASTGSLSSENLDVVLESLDAASETIETLNASIEDEKLNINRLIEDAKKQGIEISDMLVIANACETATSFTASAFSNIVDYASLTMNVLSGTGSANEATKKFKSYSINKIEATKVTSDIFNMCNEGYNLYYENLQNYK